MSTLYNINIAWYVYTESHGNLTMFTGGRHKLYITRHHFRYSLVKQTTKFVS